MAVLEGKTIAITGAGRGLGRALAAALTSDGADVAILGRGRDALEQTATLAGKRCVAYPCDVGEDDQVEATFAAIGARFGKIDALINNAAIIDFNRIVDIDPPRLRAIVNANFLGPMLAARSATPWLRKAGQGDIINISSESVRNPYAYMAAYAATKAGLESFSRGLRYELLHDGIRVSTLQIGNMADPDRTIDADPALMAKWMAENQGTLAQAPGASNFQTVIQAIKSMLLLPRDSSFELVELRPHSSQRDNVLS